MIRKNGIPLPNHISSFFKHILSKMLNYHHQARFDCLQILKEFDAFQLPFQPYQSQVVTQQSQVVLQQSQVVLQQQTNELPVSNDFFNLRARNNPIFKSTFLVQPQLFQSQIHPNIMIHEAPSNMQI